MLWLEESGLSDYNSGCFQLINIQWARFYTKLGDYCLFRQDCQENSQSGSKQTASECILLTGWDEFNFQKY